MAILRILSFILISISIDCSAQEGMKKYSYGIIARYHGDAAEHGTGFFIEKDTKLYLVTAAHCLNGIDPTTLHLIEGISSAPKEVRIFQNKIDTDFNELISLYSGQKNICILPEITPGFLDIGVLPIGDRHNFRHYFKYAEQNLGESISVGVKVFYYGYPISKRSRDQEAEKKEGRVDWVAKNGKAFEIILLSEEGDSGAPVYKETDKGPILIGVLSRGGVNSKGQNTTLIIPLFRGLQELKM